MNREEVNELIEDSKSYLEARMELLKLKLADQSTAAFAKLMAAFIIAGVFLLFLVALSFFLGIVMTEVFQDRLLGFGSVAALYFLAFFLLLVFRKSLLINPLQNTAIQSIFQDEEKDEN